LTSIRNEKAMLEYENKELKDLANKAANKLEAAEKQSDVAIIEHNKKIEELKNLQASWDKLKSDLENLQSNYNEAQGQAKDLVAKIKEYEAALNDAQTQCSNQKALLETTKKELEESKENEINLQNQISDSERKKKEKAKDADDKINYYISELNKTERKNMELEVEVTNLNNELDDFKKELSEGKESVGTWKKKANDSDDKMKLCRFELIDLRAKYDELKSIQNNLQGRHYEALNKAEGKNIELEQQVNKQKNELDDCKKKLVDLKEKEGNWRKKSEELVVSAKNNIEEIENQVKDIEKKLKESEERTEELEAELVEVESNLSNQAAESDKLKETNKELKGLVLKLVSSSEDEICELKKKLLKEIENYDSDEQSKKNESAKKSILKGDKSTNKSKEINVSFSDVLEISVLFHRKKTGLCPIKPIKQEPDSETVKDRDHQSGILSLEDIPLPTEKKSVSEDDFEDFTNLISQPQRNLDIFPLLCNPAPPPPPPKK